MTTDITSFKSLTRLDTGTPEILFRRIFSGAHLSSEPGFQHSAEHLNGGDAALLKTIMQRRTLEKDGAARKIGATVALLKHAFKVIERAEAIMTAQEERITQLEAMATTDELTGIGNRRGFYDAFVRELDLCDRDLSRGGLLLLVDLDNFKTINDTYGHQAGDACLRLVARTLGAAIRKMDYAARLGGDEFVLLLSNTEKDIAAGRAQMIAWQLNNLSLGWHGTEIPLHASVGLRGYSKGDVADQVFGAADAALYEDKDMRRRGHKRENATVSP